MKIKLFKKENNFKKKDFAFNPILYWKIAVFSIFAVILLSALFGYRLSNSINQDSAASTVNVGGHVPRLSLDRLRKVLDYFSEREKNSAQILNSPAPISDPSL
jgi:hypothetical protein